MTMPPSPLPLHHVFVDFENVHESLLDHVGQTSVHLTLLVGVHQKKLDADLVEKLLAHAESVQLVRLTTPGKNSLDFVLAYYVGRAAMVHPNAQFHIISKDTGFDALVHHLLSRQIQIYRHPDLGSLPFASKVSPPNATKKAKPLPPVRVTREDWYDRVADYLQTKVIHRPSRLKGLTSYLSAFCGKSVSAQEISLIITQLINAQHIIIGARGGVTYADDPAEQELAPVPPEDEFVDPDDIPF